MVSDNESSVQVRSIGQVLFNILKFVGFIILALVPMQILFTLINLQDQFSTFVNSVLAIICFILIVLVIFFLWNRYYKYSKEKVQKIGLRDIGFVIIYFLIARVIAIVGTYLITLIYGEEMTANDQALWSFDYSNFFVLYLLLFSLCMGVLVPIAEELTYRGIGTNLFFKKNSFWLPLIITSTIFGLMHTPTDIISFLLYGSIGVVLFLAYYRRRNILDSILVHICNNMGGAIFLLVSYIQEMM